MVFAERWKAADDDVRTKAVHRQLVLEAAVQILQRGFCGQQPRKAVGELIQSLDARRPLWIAGAFAARIEAHESHWRAQITTQEFCCLVAGVERRAAVLPDRD